MDAMKLETSQNDALPQRRVIVLDVVTKPVTTGVKRDQWRKLPSFSPNRCRRSR